MDIEHLNKKHGLSGAVRFDAGEGGLTRARITSGYAEGEVYLHGAHVTRYGRRGERPVLWMSDESLFVEGKAIRGGVPLVFPWFGPRTGGLSGSPHGFARLTAWDVVSTQIQSDGSGEIVLGLADSTDTRAVWPNAFSARYTVRVGKTLELSLAVQNTGGEPFEFEEALHTYFMIGDVRKISVAGLERTTYFDKVGVAQIREQGNRPVTFEGETDRVYQQTRTTCVIHDPVLAREITIGKSNSDSTVVWNPWAIKAKGMADFGDDEWPGTVCVETCNVGDSRIKLAPGETHVMSASIR